MCFRISLLNLHFALATFEHGCAASGLPARAQCAMRKPPVPGLWPGAGYCVQADPTWQSSRSSGVRAPGSWSE